jgi:very-short-patch-repair endonuclease
VADQQVGRTRSPTTRQRHPAHSGRTVGSRDARRFNLLVADGWTVLPTWEEVMFDRAYVLEVLRTVVDARTQVRRCADFAA